MPGCRDGHAGRCAAVYDALAERAAEAPIELDFPLGDGTVAKRKLTAGMLDANAFYALYGPDDRATFLRVLAAASRGQLLPMLRLAYSTLVIDPDDRAGRRRSDLVRRRLLRHHLPRLHRRAATTAKPMPRQIMEEAKAFAAARRICCGSISPSGWPAPSGPSVATRSGRRPMPAATIPTLILNADADPITPITMSYAILDHAKNAYMVAMEGGPHVIWGRGLHLPGRDRLQPAVRRHPAGGEGTGLPQDFIGAYSR